MTQKRQILLQNALALLCEAQRRATDLKHDTSEEIREVTHKLSTHAKAGASSLVTYWHDNKAALPKAVTKEVDGLLDRIGLSKKKAAPKKPATKKPVPKQASKKPAVKKPAAKKAPTKKTAPKQVNKQA